jgi:hypothetical protein
MIQHDLFDPPAANPRVPPLGDASRIRGLEAQVDDLKYTLNNIIQYITSYDEIKKSGRCAALVEDARAALRSRVVDYLG